MKSYHYLPHLWLRCLLSRAREVRSPAKTISDRPIDRCPFQKLVRVLPHYIGKYTKLFGSLRHCFVTPKMHTWGRPGTPQYNRIGPLCLCVYTLTTEPFDIQPGNSKQRSTWTLSRSRSYVKTIGPINQSYINETSSILINVDQSLSMLISSYS